MTTNGHQPETPENPWDRQPNETDQAWQAFTTYLNQDRAHRSLRRASRDLNKHLTTIAGWSGQHNWQRRVAAYDRHMDDRRRREREEKVLEMERAQATQLAAARQMLTVPIQEFLKRVAVARSDGKDAFANVSNEALARLATASIRHIGSVVEAERLVAGLSTQNVAPDAAVSADEARARAERMSRGEIEEYLLGVDDGRRELLAELGLEGLEGEPAGESGGGG